MQKQKQKYLHLPLRFKRKSPRLALQQRFRCRVTARTKTPQQGAKALTHARQALLSSKQSKLCFYAQCRGAN